MKRSLVAAVVAVALALQPAVSAGAAPVAPALPIDGIPVDAPPSVSAKSWILYDDTHGVVLGALEPDVERAMASTTKVMTALVALRRGDPAQVVQISQNAIDAGESEIGLVLGEEIRLGLLIETALIRSANDAAVAVAEAVGGSEEGFVAMMNAEVEALGLEHSRFANPHGLDAPDHYSSARDLLDMTLAAMEFPAFAEAVRASQVAFPSAPDGTERIAKTTNRLLAEYEGAIGVKTGFTFRAGLVLIAAADRDGRRIYAVVMGSEGESAHFRDATALLDYGFSSFGVVPLVVAGEPYALRRSGQVEDVLTASANLEAFVYLAAAGLLTPQLAVENGDAELVLSDDLPEVELAEPVRTPLPSLSSAFAWILDLWSELMGADP